MGQVESASNAGQRRNVILLGSTGSIGTQAADIIRRNPDRFRLTGIAAGGGHPELLASQAIELGAEVVAVASAAAVPDVRAALAAAGSADGARRKLPEVIAGPDAVADLAARPCDVVLNAVTGAVGLAATLAALQAGRVLALANKESLIMGGPLVAGIAAPGQIVPVDSEHSAIAQCLRGGRAAEVSRLIVTASGGPFLHRSKAELADVTPAQALAHPTWTMGPVITVNSATLVNKGLELIEAHLLFGLGFDRIDVVVHRQSVIHSMVRVHRRLHAGPGEPAGHANRHRARPCLAGPGTGRSASDRLDSAPYLDVRAARRGSFPGCGAGKARRSGRRDDASRL